MISQPSIWGALSDAGSNDIFAFPVNAGTPSDGTSGTGAGLCGPGCLLIDTTGKVVYINTNTKASPTWAAVGGGGGGDVTLNGIQTLTNKTLGNTNTLDILDTLFRISDNTTPTKKIAFELSGLTGATTRTLAVPDADLTIVGLATTQTLTNKTLTSPTLTAPVLGVATATSLAAAGLIKSSTPTGGVGYATGAGLTATQSTNKSTTVTNAASAPSLCGAITMDAAALNAGVIVSFTFTNSAIAATDVLILNHISGGTVGSYTLNAQAGAGSAVINVRNNTAGNLSEAIVIQYVVIKGVNA